ncbi:filamentous hemagglutinin N-terminal domain-containing protein [Aquabacterium fontiphilum]|uniref:two-partner secretion domain-containing protein n=1 Tax=Aquabacterium fontiphilum TaxID=450365 RepID=UPI001376C5F8|nr:hemagglutinin repeat-containing protein [Aquabacterium fontiphilum]NBD20317.1 filamentous hemagglutinin N-terminal domain-containing protein [Aquabacterium fontiphilum]
MNKHCHRVVFNAARGVYMAVAEVVRVNAGGSPSRSSRGRIRASATAFALSVLAGSLVQAQIVADPAAPTAQRPVVRSADNGVPVVNITAPTVGGVSRNQYQQLDVTRSGVILNNNRSDSLTQLGGWVQGNNALTSGSASVILNEVTSGTPSQLRGFMEVAGQKAQVVVANPAGITCDGCGFINASRATLTTGTPLMLNGHLDGYLVRGGGVRITGDGLNALSTDFTDILTRSLEVRAGIWANRLNVVTGQNRISADAAVVTPAPTQDASAGETPAFAVDTAELGGMYAGHIRLVATESGVGVRHHGGMLATVGDVVIDAAGMLTSQGSVYAKHDVVVSAQSLSNTSGGMFAEGGLHISVSGDLVNSSGWLSALNDVSIRGHHILNRFGSIYAGAMFLDDVVREGSLRILMGGGLLNEFGLLQATQDISINASTTREPYAVPWDGWVGYKPDIYTFGGSMTAGRLLQIGVGDAPDRWRSLEVSDATLSAGAGMSLQVESLVSGLKRWGSPYDPDLNKSGNVYTGGSLDIRASHHMDFSGRMMAGRDISLRLADPTGPGSSWYSQFNGEMYAVGSVTIRSDSSFELQRGAQVVGTSVAFVGGSRFTSFGHIEADDVHISLDRGRVLGYWIEVDGEGPQYFEEKILSRLENLGGGTILANAITLSADHIWNSYPKGADVGGPYAGSIIARDNLSIAADRFENGPAGTAISYGALAIGARISEAGEVVGRSKSILNEGGLIESAGDMLLSADQILNENPYFFEGLLPVGDPERLSLIQPKGSTARIPVQNLRWQRWERAGQYRYDLSPDPYEGVPARLGQTPVPLPDQVDCDDPDVESTCRAVPDAAYLRGDPAWAYFNVVQPDPEPEPFALQSPQAPTLSAPVDPGPDAELSLREAFNDAKQAFDAAWADYLQRVVAYEHAQQQHAAAVSAWQTQTSQRYDELTDSILAYNATFEDDVIREWTRYDFTRTTLRTSVLGSRPGQIISGGNMVLDAAEVVNDKSRIVAGGSLVADLDRLDHRPATGLLILRDQGSVRQSYTERRRNSVVSKKRTYREWTEAATYEPLDDITEISLGVGELLYGRAFSPSDVEVAAAEVPAVVPVVPLEAFQLNASDLALLPIFSVAANPDARYVLETNPRFTENKSWTSSDVLFEAIRFDGDATLRRLGDGFAEQRLMREQVLALTGQRYLGNHRDDDSQYLALLTAAATFATQHQLRPGVALSAQQIAALTTDIVWLEEQRVTLPDGRIVAALVPRVYLAPRKGDLAADGALFGSALVGRTVDLHVADQLTNGGSIAGRDLTVVRAGNVLNDGGNISGKAVFVLSDQDIVNRGGTIAGKEAVVLEAGRDVVIESTTRHDQKETTTVKPVRQLSMMVMSVTGHDASGQVGVPPKPAPKLGPTASYEQTSIARMAGVYVTGRDGVLVASAGQDISVIGARMRSQGDLVMVAGRDVDLGTVDTSGSQTIRWGTKRSLTESWSEEVGASLQARNDIVIQSGGQVSARGAEILADLGSLEATAAGNISLEARESTEFFDERRQKTDRGRLSKTRTTERLTYSATQAHGSTLSGDEVLLQSGQDVTLVGSSVVSTRGVTVLAQGDVRLDAAAESLEELRQKEVKKSGVSSTGGFGVSIGTQKRSDRASEVGELAEASTLGSLSGDVTVVARGRYSQTGSDVIAPSGDVRISAAEVDVVDARQLSRSELETRFKQSGLTLSLNNAVVDGVQTHQRVQDARGQTQDSRTQALATITQVLNAGQMLDAYQKDKATDVSVSLMLGSSQSQSTTRNTGDTTRGSTVAAGQDISLQATGVEGQAGTGDLLVRGSRIVAQGDVVLSAQDALTLQAAQDRYSERSENKSSSAAVGVKIGSEGMGFSASGSAGRGRGDGDDVVQVNTQVQAGQTVGMSSGGDTTLQGAVVQGQQVQAHVGGDLTVQSLQDTSTYSSRQQNVSGSVTIGSGAGSGGQASYSSSKVNSDYASVVQRSGIEAGDGGFQVNVQGQTTLQGGVIASTDKAVDEGRNSLNTQGLSLSDIDNRASYEAKAVSVSVGTSAGQNSAGIGQASDSAASTTTAGVSGLAGDHSVRTGDASQGLDRIFDREGVTQDVTAQATVMAEFGKQASKAAADYTQRKRETLKLEAWQAEQAGDDAKAASLRADAAQWDEGGDYHLLMQALVGGASGGLSAALGAAAAAKAGPWVEQMTSELPLSEPLKAVAGMVLSTALGWAAGQDLGAAAAFNVDTNNRRLHSSERKMAIELAKASGGRYTVAEIEAQLRLMPNLALGAAAKPEVYTNMQNPETQARWAQDRQHDDGFEVTVTNNTVVEKTSAARGDVQAFIVGATSIQGGTMDGWSPYLMSKEAAADLLKQAAQSATPRDDAGPRHHACASTDCLLYQANYNPNHPQNQAELKRMEEALKAAGVVVGAPALALALTTPAGQLAVKTLLWNQTSAVSGLAGGSVNVGAQLVKTGEVDLKEAGMATVTSMAGGGVVGASKTAFESGRTMHAVGLTGVLAANAAGAVVTGSPQGATAGGAVAGYAAGQLPGPMGVLGGPAAQEFVTWVFSLIGRSPQQNAGSGR